MTTLKDIARHTGLSVTQVSRALNDYPDVSVETKEKVRAAALELDYHPNLSARRLVSGKSGVVGLVLPRTPTEELENVFMQIVGGLSSHFARNGMQFVLHIAEGQEDVIDVYRRLIQGGTLDGFVLLEPIADDPRIAFLKSRNVPFVLHGRAQAKPDYAYFDIDNFAVAHRLSSYLIGRGHRSIVFLNGTRGRTYVIEREAGFRAALDEAGIAFAEGMHRNTDMSEQAGMRLCLDLLKNASAPTALIAGNTLVAKGIYRAAQALGLTIPDDVSVVAHDDLLPLTRAGAFEPSLTVTESAIEKSWRPLAEFLVGAVSGRPLSELQHIGDLRFLERDSVRDRGI